VVPRSANGEKSFGSVKRVSWPTDQDRSTPGSSDYSAAKRCDLAP
jgi:hypothetical protein